MAELHAYRYKRGRGCNVKVWFPECPLFGGKTSVDASHLGASLSER